MATASPELVHPTIESTKIATTVVMTKMTGRITAEVCAHALPQFISILDSTPSPSWIIETLEITGFDPAAVSWGGRWFHTFKQRGGRSIAYVSSLGAARMAARALSFSVGLQIQSFDALKAAYTHFEVPTPVLPRSQLG